jgi:hypothetical protein
MGSSPPRSIPDPRAVATSAGIRRDPTDEPAPIDVADDVRPRPAPRREGRPGGKRAVARGQRILGVIVPAIRAGPPRGGMFGGRRIATIGRLAHLVVAVLVGATIG